LGEATVTIRARDNDGVAPYVLEVQSEGKPPVIVTGDTNDRAYNEAFRELFLAANSSSIDSSPAVMDVFQELDRLDDPPF
jgi:hypothetical protein